MSVKYPNYVNLTSSSEEQPNERTPSPPPRKKSLSPPQAPSKSISSKSTHYTSSSSPSESPTPTHVAPPPKLCFKAIAELAMQIDNASTTKDDLRKAYEKCNDIPQESRALIDTFLKQESDKDYEMHLAMFRKAAK
ncbi:hypothetical protein Tco_0417527 [Tanacetum coccineum]